MAYCDKFTDYARRVANDPAASEGYRRLIGGAAAEIARMAARIGELERANARERTERGFFEALFRLTNRGEVAGVDVCDIENFNHDLLAATAPAVFGEPQWGRYVTKVSTRFGEFYRMAGRASFKIATITEEAGRARRLTRKARALWLDEAQRAHDEAQNDDTRQYFGWIIFGISLGESELTEERIYQIVLDSEAKRIISNFK